MKAVGRMLKFGWWLAVGYIPLMLWHFYRDFHAAIRCPVSGDCYVPGSEHLLRIELNAAWSAVLLWPACLWFVVVQPARKLMRHSHRVGPTHDAQPINPAEPPSASR